MPRKKLKTLSRNDKIAVVSPTLLDLMSPLC